MTKRFAVTRKTMRDYRGPILAMWLVAALIGLMDLVIYPSYRDSLGDFRMPEAMQAMIGEGLSIASPEGFVSAEFYSWVPLLFITVAIIAGTGVTAGEESSGTMDVLLAQPVSRRRLALEKAAGVAIPVTVGMIASLAGFYVAKLFADFPIGPWRLFETTVSMIPVVLLFAAIALWAGVTFPSRGTASMFSIGVVVVAYFLQLMGPTVGLMETPQKLSPFYWSDAATVLVNGFQWIRFLVMLGVAALVLVAMLWFFERRDITGTREWSWRLWRRNNGGTEAPGHAPRELGQV